MQPFEQTRKAPTVGFGYLDSKLVFLLILLIIVPGAAFLKKTEDTHRNMAVTSLISPFETAPVNCLTILANLTAISIQDFQYRIHFAIVPNGSYLAPSVLSSRVNESIEIYFGAALVQFQYGQQTTSQDLTYSFTSGDENDYPFDVYRHEFVLSASTLSDRTLLDSKPIPLAVALTGAIESWAISFTIYEDPVSFEIRLGIIVERASTTKFFSLFVVIISWMLALSAMVTALSIWVRERMVEPPLLAVFASLLFALPQIRNAQPDVPKIGCTVDVAGFFWAMAIVALSLLSLLWNYIYMTGGGHEHPNSLRGKSFDRERSHWDHHGHWERDREHAHWVSRSSGSHLIPPVSLSNVTLSEPIVV